MATDNTTPKNTLKSWFKRGLKPLEAQFYAWMDSYWHKNEKIPVSSVDELEVILNNKAETKTVEDQRLSIGTLNSSISDHIGNRDIHKTSEEIRGEIIDKDIPETIARKNETDEALSQKVDKVAGKDLISDEEKQKISDHDEKLIILDELVCGTGPGSVSSKISQALAWEEYIN